MPRVSLALRWAREALSLRSCWILLSDHDLDMRIPIHWTSDNTDYYVGEQASGCDPEIWGKACHDIITDAETLATFNALRAFVDIFAIGTRGCTTIRSAGN